ncbi:glutathione S-transferase [Octadecabacter sp.]|nr:glutathione S-transferase [Octadecabacter sp.]
MTYQLYIGNRLYFSWSIAAYLMFERFGLAEQVKTTVFRPETESDVRRLMAENGLGHARTLPTAITPEGAVLNDSMAIAEELASRHTDIAFWPTDPLARATARALANEMHSSFGGLRGNWPVNLRVSNVTQTPPPQIEAELDRLEVLWTHARSVSKPDGPWLCGEYSLVDAIFAPMAVRLAGYDFHTRPTTKAYVEAHLADPALRRWRAMGLANEPQLAKFEIDAPEAPWRGPVVREAKVVETGPSENALCPYSGTEVTHFMEMDGRTFGFCNAFCRDKTVNDPAAWPKFMAIV